MSKAMRAVDVWHSIPYDEMHPDLILPGQLCRIRAWTPEQALLASLLEDALETLQKTSAIHSFNAQELRYETREWFQSSEVVWGSFEFICEHLDMDAEALRMKALRL